VSDRDAPDLVALFEGLGFARTARHRTKAVDLFQQGGVNFVVNCEKDTFPHSFQLLHSASVCALTLRVDSVGKAMERARAMDCPAHVGRIGPGEKLIPAVGGVEGSLI